MDRTQFKSAGCRPPPAALFWSARDNARRPQSASCTLDSSQTERLELLEHLGNTAADHLALVAQVAELDADALGFGQPCVRHVQLAREALVLLRQPRLI